MLENMFCCHKSHVVLVSEWRDGSVLWNAYPGAEPKPARGSIGCAWRMHGAGTVSYCSEEEWR